MPLPRLQTLLLGALLLPGLVAGMLIAARQVQACTATDCTEIRVDDLAALQDALQEAPGGATLLLAAGDYGTLTLSTARVPGASAAAPVTIRSADPADPARFSRLVMQDAAHLRLESLAFLYTFTAGDDEKLRPFEIRGSTDIVLRGSLLQGDLASGGRAAAKDGYPTGIGLWLQGSTDIEISGNEITRFARGLIVYGCEQVRILGNNLHGVRSDGMNFADVRDVRIERNAIHDFARALDAKDHADMIQFWTAGTKRPNTDIVIRDNILNVGGGWFTQSIFMRNEEMDRKKAGDEMLYRNITIENNVIINAHLHGITLGQADGVRIAGNTLVRQRAAAGKGQKAGLWVPQIRVKSSARNVTIADNIVPVIEGYEDQSDWAVKGNLIIQDRDPAAPGYYDSVFVAALTGDRMMLASFAYLPGGPADDPRLGASALRLEANPARPVPLIRFAPDAQTPARIVFDASLSRGPADMMAGARYEWDFGDGTAAAGPVVAHDFAPGRHEVTLILHLPDGSRSATKVTATVVGPDLLRFDPVAGALIAYGSGVPSPLANVRTLRLPDGSHVLPLGQGGAVQELGGTAIAGLAEARDIKLQLRLRAAGTEKPAGEVLRLSDSLIISVGVKGDLAVSLTGRDSAKPTRLRTPPLSLLAGGWHDIVIRHTAATGLITVEIDGTVQAEGRAVGPLKPVRRGGLTLGNPTGKKTFDGEIAALFLQTNTAGAEDN